MKIGLRLLDHLDFGVAVALVKDDIADEKGVLTLNHSAGRARNSVWWRELAAVEFACRAAHATKTPSIDSIESRSSRMIAHPHGVALTPFHGHG